ncbi:MAG: V-type ATP synthase subunit D [Anaerolineales bacterium]
MARMNVAPTRSNLMEMREARDRAQEGYEILDKKREVLTTELIHIAREATEMQRRVWAMLAEAYHALELARLSMGREHLEWTALSVNKTIEVDITPHSVMGVVIPDIEAHGAPPETPYGLGDTTVALDEAVALFREIVTAIPALAEMMTTVWRLARELQKTQRRVNALQHTFIPRYEETIIFIENALEEREREEAFRLKLLKSKQQSNKTAK